MRKDLDDMCDKVKNKVDCNEEKIDNGKSLDDTSSFLDLVFEIYKEIKENENKTGNLMRKCN